MRLEDNIFAKPCGPQAALKKTGPRLKMTADHWYRLNFDFF